jgi:hypothetical protein
MVKHTAESVSKYSVDELKNLRANALRLGSPEVVSLCDSELQRRKPSKKSTHKATFGSAARGRPVRGFHFVCPKELGVTSTGGGSFRTGIWAVAAAVAERAQAVGAYVAFYNSKSELSYLQGVMKGWHQLERKNKAIPNGIEFIVDPTDTPLPWRGDGAGERGYYYGDGDDDDGTEK